MYNNPLQMHMSEDLHNIDWSLEILLSQVCFSWMKAFSLTADIFEISSKMEF